MKQPIRQVINLCWGESLCWQDCSLGSQ